MPVREAVHDDGEHEQRDGGRGDRPRALDRAAPQRSDGERGEAAEERDPRAGRRRAVKRMAEIARILDLEHDACGEGDR